MAGLGSSRSIEVGFQYRRRKGLADLYEPTDTWKSLPPETRSATGAFTRRLQGVTREADYEFRAVARHPLITINGVEKPVNPSAVVRLH